MMTMKIALIRTLLWLCLAVQAAFFVLAWTTYAPVVGAVAVEITANGMNTAAKLAMTPGQRAVGAAIALPALLVLAYGLWRLDRLLLNFRRQQLFTARSIGHLRMFAGATLLATALAIVELPARMLALWLMRGGERRLSVGLSSEQLMLMLVCALFYLITRLMHEGRRLAEENEGFV